MRPVRLDIDGFASFRELTHVDFTDVDYFALVGPTGSGKSTIIDAITFALYGTAHRWERSNAVAYALAPTSNRCTVSLIFDVGGQRYQAVREVRRVGANTIQQKNARLERFTDPTACPPPGEETDSDVLASEVREMTPAVAELLGLDFDDFCQCVVLPQGEFARFLKAKASDRQDILLKLLGAGHYEEIGKRAGRRAADAQKEADVYADQLGTLAHASVEALAATQAEAALLEGVAVKISDQVNLTISARDQQRQHKDAQAAAENKLAVLSGLAAPDGSVQRHERLAGARTAHASADETSNAATASLRVAMEAAANGPQRVTIEAFERLYTDSDNVESLLVAAAKDEQVNTTAAQRAEKDAARAAEALAEARATAATAGRAAADTKQTLDTLELRSSRLRGVIVPADLDATLDRASQLTTALTEAEDAVNAARADLARLEDELRDLPDPRRLRALGEQAQQLRAEAQTCRAAHTDLEQARTSSAAAAAAVGDADTARSAAQHHLDLVLTTAGAAALRPTLEIGHACPVCTQTVQTIPPLDEAPDLQAAQDRVADASARLVSAQQAAQSAQDHVASRQAHAEHSAALLNRAARTVAREAAAAAARVEVVVGEWAGAAWSPDPAGIDEHMPGLLAVLEQTTTATTRLLTNLDQARSHLAQAETARETARRDRDSAAGKIDEVRFLLARTHAALADFGAPQVDASTLNGAAAGWRVIAGWADEQLVEVDTALLPAARTAATTAVDAFSAAEATLAQAETRSAHLTALAREAASAAAAAQTRHTGLLARNHEIAAQLAAAPGRHDLAGLLDQARQLEEAREVASSLVEKARVAAHQAAGELREALATVSQDRNALGSARDKASSWSPPPFEAQRLEDDLPGCWDELLAWSAEQVEQAGRERDLAQRAAAETADLAQGALTALIEALEEHDLDASGISADPRSAERIVAVAHSEAAARVQALNEARERAGALAAKEATAREKATVAGELRSLLRADKFGNWLATAALDTLVAGASDSLMQLSDGQFTLTHIKGDFHVIDHFDADSERSVKTLSGGETFQASLALALSLSEQLATLAAGGNAKLDSIFLDEGFGTLDPESLETVAATLETLAQGERMVGVVTHVAALAERTPIRFAVHHTGRTSSVERETT